MTLWVVWIALCGELPTSRLDHATRGRVIDADIGPHDGQSGKLGCGHKLVEKSAPNSLATGRWIDHDLDVALVFLNRPDAAMQARVTGRGIGSGA